MSTNNKNSVSLSGIVVERPFLKYYVNSEPVYVFTLRVNRKSAAYDDIQVYTKDIAKVHLGQNVMVLGEAKTYMRDKEYGSKMMVYVMAMHISVLEFRQEDENLVELTGVICKIKDIRKTPFGRVITDVIVAVPNTDGFSSYIPCVVWGGLARSVDKKSLVGDHVMLTGRFQSRTYTKIVDQRSEIRTAYELSVLNMKKVA